MRRALTALTVALVLVAPGCGKSSNPETTTTASSSASSSASSQSPAQPQSLNIDIRISGGNVTPTNAEWTARVNETITLHVTSDTVDQFHVHSVPEHEFVVTDVGNQEFQFTVDVPGNVEVELHKLDRTVGTIHVQP
jgi:ABC-type phosphate transport system substrate-binding protein